MRDSGAYAAVRTFAEQPGRGIRIVNVSGGQHGTDREKLAHGHDLTARGMLTPRVAEVPAPGRPPRPTGWRERGGLRGRLVLAF